MVDDRLLGGSKHELDSGENNLRPKDFSEFPGQDRVKDRLKIMVQAAKGRNDSLDHVLLCGPPGLGKTTLGHIIAIEMGVELKVTSGPAIEKKGDLAAILTSLPPSSVLFIDEIHRINRTIEEYLYSAMEDFYIDIVTGEGLGAKAMQFKLEPFTLVGATTRSGLLNAPFRDRFGITERLDFYSPGDLATIVLRSAQILNIKIDDDGAFEIASRCRGTPRISNRLLKRIRDYAQIKFEGSIDKSVAREVLLELEVDSLGLDYMDRKILKVIVDKFEGGPVGIDTISSAMSEQKDTVEEVYEPYLIKEGFLIKTPRGRVATKRALEHLKEVSI